MTDRPEQFARWMQVGFLDGAARREHDWIDKPSRFMAHKDGLAAKRHHPTPMEQACQHFYPCHLA